jgi:micrococcal nuclease
MAVFLRIALILCFFGIAANVARSETPPSFPVIQKMLSGDEVLLTNGQILRLEGVIRPFSTSPELCATAINSLQALTANHNLIYDNGIQDRYGRTVAQVYAVGTDSQKIWIQGELLKQGLAFVYPPTGNESHLAEMRQLETAARLAKAGIWGNADYDDVLPNDAWRHYGHFAFVRGRIVDAARIKNKVYLNFGENWRTDMTVEIAAHNLRNFREAQIDPLTLKGKTIRARGWIKRNFGPMIEVTSPTQLEILETP